jgi:hypothetical protein
MSMTPHARNVLLGSPFKFMYYFRGMVGQFGNIYILLDIPFKGCQGLRIIRQSCIRCHVLHAVSMHAPCMRCQWPRMHHAWSVIDPCMHYACMQCQWPRMHVSFHFLKFFEKLLVHAVSMTPQIRIYIRKDSSPLIRGPGRMFSWRKTEGRKSYGTVPLTLQNLFCNDR